MRHGRQPASLPAGLRADPSGAPPTQERGPLLPAAALRPRRAGTAAARLPQSKMAARPAPRAVKPRRPRRPRQAALTWHGHSARAQPRA